MAGIRIATVTTIGLVTVAALLGIGGLGQLILIGLNRPVRTAVTVGVVLSVVRWPSSPTSLLRSSSGCLTPWATQEAELTPR